MVRRGGVDIDRRTAVLRRWPGRRVIHVRGKLSNHVSGRRGDRGRSGGHRRGRGLAVNQMRGTAPLGRMLHGVADGRRRRRWRGIVLLGRHDVMRVGYHLLGLIFGVMVRRGRRWRFSATGAGIVLDRDSDEIAVLPGRNAESVLVDGARGRWCHGHLGGGGPDVVVGRVVMLVGHVLERRRGRHQDVLLRREVAQVMLVGWHDEPFRDVSRRRSDRRVNGFQRRTCHRLASPHVPVVDVSLQVSLRQVCSLAPLHDAAHEEGPADALLDSLHWIVTASLEKRNGI